MVEDFVIRDFADIQRKNRYVKQISEVWKTGQINVWLDLVRKFSGVCVLLV